MNALETDAARSPRFIETADDVLSVVENGSVRATAEFVVAARQQLQAASDRLLGAKDRAEMDDILAEVMPAMEFAVHVVSLGLRLTGVHTTVLPSSRVGLLERLRNRGASNDIIERIRLGLLAADDEASLLRYLPGGIEAHPELWKEDAKGRFLLMTIAKWVGAGGEPPSVWDDLTYAFLDSAGRAFGLASVVASQNAPYWSSKVA